MSAASRRTAMDAAGTTTGFTPTTGSTTRLLGRTLGAAALAASLLLAPASRAFGPTVTFGPTAAAAQTVVITNARIYPVAGSMIERGSVLIRDGRIAAVGPDVQVPQGARVIDGSGKVVTPGLLDSNSQIGLVEIGAYPNTNDTRTADDRITAAFDPADGLNPRSTVIPVTRIEGITRAIVAPSAAGSIIAGQGLLIDLAPGSAKDMVEKDPVAMFAVLGEGGSARVGGTRGAASLRLREILEDARDYAANTTAYQRNQRRDYSVSRLDLEALVPVVQGKLPLAIQANRASDIRTAIRLSRKYDFKLILVGAAEGWLVADEIARAGVPVIMDPMTDIPQFADLAATLENAGRMSRAGVDVIFASFTAHNARNLKQEAGNAVANGMPFDAALRAVTLAPAKLWGIDDRYGSLEPGKDADVVVWDGDPFDVLTNVEHVFIKGREVPITSRQLELAKRYMHRSGDWPAAYI
ncbi:MAG: amidohydrolase family protein, partial [Gemmatimonadota bacterium]